MYPKVNFKNNYYENQILFFITMFNFYISLCKSTKIFPGYYLR
ncbi:hypothetical protein FLAVO9AF_530004 [Flavobacterium sp. 9AF]|nr:hypothetical protein FLAVO9AF_530004 [Flavobacterium sp. 9AF]